MRNRPDGVNEDVNAFNRFVYFYDVANEARSQHDIRELLRQLRAIV